MFTAAERLVVLVVIVLMALGTWWSLSGSNDPWTQPAPEPVQVMPAGPPTIRVHVAGSVCEPGVYELEHGSRIADAVLAAGGPTDDGCPDALNLAALLSDGQRVWVPARDEGEAIGQGGAGQTLRVNVNRASWTELQLLPGIGPALATRIIDHRRAHGFFSVAEDLLAVSGIGPKTLERLRPHIALD